MGVDLLGCTLLGTGTGSTPFLIFVLLVDDDKDAHIFMHVFAGLGIYVSRI